MWVSLNSWVKRRAPAQHRILKSIFRPWTQGGFSVPVLKKVGGQFCWVHPRLLTAEATEHHVHTWIRECLRPGQIFFDVGAHYGLMSLTAAHRVGRKGRVIAFEPAPPLLEILRYHRTVNRLKQMEVAASAVSDIDRESIPFFLVNGGLSFGNSLTPYRPKGHAKECRVVAISLDSYCSRHNCWPDVLKIDVEGAELMVLRGAAAVLREKRPKLILAVHPPWLPDGDTIGALFELVESYGYRVQRSKIYPFDGHEFADYLLSCEPAACVRPGTSL